MINISCMWKMFGLLKGSGCHQLPLMPLPPVRIPIERRYMFLHCSTARVLKISHTMVRNLVQAHQKLLNLNAKSPLIILFNLT
ncbi:hypothetical protein KC19_8G014700 [Ceratodon purpureus]|uniref:Uncharacterized protein n=1 Tax=Ceratodon purpureus TaxID=3225 RepID=A0A8T0GZN3_CERPU|nr:hypothetical protein KC19_8G014700 [Ceratodon purpureus]